MSKLHTIHNKCYAIYHEFGGYEHNDQKIYQLRGLESDINEYDEWGENHESVKANADATLLWFKWVKKSMVLKSAQPDSIYG